MTNRVPGTDTKRGDVFLHLGGPKNSAQLIQTWVSVEMAPAWSRGGGRSGQQLVVVIVDRQSVSIIRVKFCGEEGCGNRDVCASGVVQGNEGRSWERERVDGRAPVEAHHFGGGDVENCCAEEFIV